MPAVMPDGCTEKLCLPGRGLTVTELLRVLDILRRRVARDTRGREGVFAGFDRLDIAGWAGDNDAAHVLLTARVVNDDGASQLVEYAAMECAHPPGVCEDTGASAPLVRGVGRTVGLRLTPPTTPPRRFAVASPHR